jgi:Na+-translocating ferredoxin:NAD+ oxidoreductase RnfG subunit
MRALFVLPLALGTPSAIYATAYLSVEQAQAVLFPGEALHADTRQLSGAQIGAIKNASGEAPLSKTLRAWRATGGGWFIVDEVVGKHEFITFAVALDAGGAVKGVEILDYREAYGGEVRNAKWRAQFTGRQAGTPLRLGNEIKNISGATLSSKHVTDGVRRVLATHALVLAHAG